MVSLCVESSVRILVGFQGVVERHRFLWFDTVEYFINLQWLRRLKRKWRFGGSLIELYPYGAKEWNVNWIHKTGGEKNNWNLKSDEYWTSTTICRPSSRNQSEL